MIQPEAFDAFYKDARTRLLAQTYALTGDLPAARSAVRDSFIVTWHHWRKVQPAARPRGVGAPARVVAGAATPHRPDLAPRQEPRPRGEGDLRRARASSRSPSARRWCSTGSPRCRSPSAPVSSGSDGGGRADDRAPRRRSSSSSATWRPTALPRAVRPARRAGRGRPRGRAPRSCGVPGRRAVVPTRSSVPPPRSRPSSSPGTVVSGSTLEGQPEASDQGQAASGDEAAPDAETYFTGDRLLEADELGLYLDGPAGAPPRPLTTAAATARATPCQQERYADPDGVSPPGPHLRDQPRQGRAGEVGGAVRRAVLRRTARRAGVGPGCAGTAGA